MKRTEALKRLILLGWFFYTLASDPTVERAQDFMRTYGPFELLVWCEAAATWTEHASRWRVRTSPCYPSVDRVPTKARDSELAPPDLPDPR